MRDSFSSLQLTLVLAVFLVYLVMASQFESLIHPFVILLTIPLAVIGAVWALWLTGTTVNVVAYIGLIMLAGIVVNHSIVLIDAVNQARERGLDKVDAIVDAGRARLRPILITKLTTILGLVPMAIGIGEGAELRAPMAITVIGGVTLTTFLTLLVIPVVYSVMDRKAYAAGNRRGARVDAEADMLHTSTALRRPVTTVMIFIALVLVGLISLRLLPLEEFPDVTFPGMQVIIPYPGSTPEEVEQLITRPVEEALSTLAGIEELRSRSEAEQATFQIALRLGPRHRRRGVRRAHQARFDPLGAAGRRRPHPRVLVQRVRPAGRGRRASPPTRISPTSTTRSSATCKRPLERVPGVARVELQGVVPREVRILIDAGRMAAHSIDVQRLAHAPAEEQLLRERRRDHRAGAALQHPPDRRIPLARRHPHLRVTASVRLADIADVELIAPSWRSAGISTTARRSAWTSSRRRRPTSSKSSTRRSRRSSAPGLCRSCRASASSSSATRPRASAIRSATCATPA